MFDEKESVRCKLAPPHDHIDVESYIFPSSDHGVWYWFFQAFFPTLESQDSSEEHAEATIPDHFKDQLALMSDWIVVGNCFRRAIPDVENPVQSENPIKEGQLESR